MNNISFRGLHGACAVADKQQGEDCWLEALENVIQLFIGDTGGSLNSLSDYLRKQMIAQGYAGYIPKEDNVDNQVIRYPEILSLFGISTHWYNGSTGAQGQPFPFDHNVLIKALNQNRVIFARVEVSYLPNYKGYKGGHALVITNIVKDNNTGNLFYCGLDSNFPKQECYWPINDMGNAIAKKSSWTLAGQPQLLITDQPAKWPYQTFLK